MMHWNLQTQRLVLHKSVASYDDYNSSVNSFSRISTSFLFGPERADF
jgi:hypothetical protein